MTNPTSDTDNPTAAIDTDTIYRHQKRPDWGRAILLWERSGKRGYQFEDGKQRVFERAYCNLFTQVDQPADETRAISKNLLARAGRQKQVVPSNKKTKAVPLTAQLALLRDFYEKGFRDDAWIADKRSSKTKRLKRHRDPLIARAQELLNRDRLDTLRAEGRHADIVAAMMQLADATDLTTKRHAQPLERVRATEATELADALYDVLYGAEDYTIRFERWVAVLARTTRASAAWQLATLYPAIVHPAEHLFVKPKITDLQAEWMAPQLRMTKLPNGATYARLREMAIALGERLGEAGFAPRDLLDLHDFMWETLRPKARTMIAKGTDGTR